jgi:hypothetical protein
MREIDCNSILNKGRLEIKGSCSEIATAIAKIDKLVSVRIPLQISYTYAIIILLWAFSLVIFLVAYSGSMEKFGNDLFSMFFQRNTFDLKAFGIAAAFSISICLCFRIFFLEKKLVGGKKIGLALASIRLFGCDMGKGALLQLSLDLSAHNKKAKLTHKNKQGPWTISHYYDPWLRMSGKMTDGTRFNLLVAERFQSRYRPHKRKSIRERSTTITTVKFLAKPGTNCQLNRIRNKAGSLVGLPTWATLKTLEISNTSLKLTASTSEKWSFGAKPVKGSVDFLELIALAMLSLYEILNLANQKRNA